MSEGLFSRWAKRKQDVAAANATQAAPAADPVPAKPDKTDPSQGTVATAPDSNQSATNQAQPLPSIESLTADSDFSPFMARDVAPDMRNQAMKKLFTDPRYNVMDGLDIYIDDYGKPDPLPEGWLQLMNQSKTLRLFETPEEEAARLGGDATAPQKASVAASAQSEGTAGELDVTDGVATAPIEALPVEPLPAAKAPNGSSENLAQDIHTSQASESKLTQT
jgi:hypothetical protein